MTVLLGDGLAKKLTELYDLTLKKSYALDIAGTVTYQFS